MAALSGRLAAASLLADLASTAPVPRRRLRLVVRRRAERRRPPRPHRHRLHRQRVLALLRLGRRRGGGDPLDHCAVNVALYGAGASRWAMTERGRAQPAARTPTRSRSGRARSPGTATRSRSGSTRSPRRCPRASAARCALQPAGLTGRSFALDAAGRHRWWPIAPCSRVEVALERPGAALERRRPTSTPTRRRAARGRLRHWDWSRAALPRRHRHPLRRAAGATGGGLRSRMRFDPPGRRRGHRARPPRVDPAAHALAHAARRRAPTTARASVVADPRGRAVLRPLGAGLAPAAASRSPAMHESLSLDRFRAPWVQAMLPFRMPRALR